MRPESQSCCFPRELRRRNTRCKNPQLVAQHCFVASFRSTFRVFYLVWWTCRATKRFVTGWRKLLRTVERGSTLSNKFCLCCSFFMKLTACHATKFAHVGRQVEGFRISYFAVFKRLIRSILSSLGLVKNYLYFERNLKIILYQDRKTSRDNNKP